MEQFEKGFGAIEREPTPQDVMIGSFSTPNQRPSVYMPPFTGIIEDQMKTPSCGAHAGQSLKQVLESFRGSPEYLWKKIKSIDGFPPENGTDMLSIMKVLNKTGITPYFMMPNNTNVDIKTYTDPSTITPAMDTEALNNRVGVYAFTNNPTLEQLKQAIYDHKAVIMLLRVGTEWWTKEDGSGSWSEADILPLRSTVPITSGHFVTAIGYDEKYIYFVNEWSSGWGRNGIGYFGEDYMSRVVEIGTTINLSISTYVFTKTLKLGSTGFDVKQLQMKLNSILGQDLIVDGNFGLNTKQAVERFQTHNGLIDDGIVGPLTNAKLNG